MDAHFEYADIFVNMIMIALILLLAFIMKNQVISVQGQMTEK